MLCLDASPMLLCIQPKGSVLSSPMVVDAYPQWLYVRNPVVFYIQSHVCTYTHMCVMLITAWHVNKQIHALYIHM